MFKSGQLYDYLTQNNELHTIVKLLTDPDEDHIAQAKQMFQWDDTEAYFSVVLSAKREMKINVFNLTKINKSKIFWSVFNKKIEIYDR